MNPSIDPPRHDDSLTVSRRRCLRLLAAVSVTTLIGIGGHPFACGQQQMPPPPPPPNIVVILTDDQGYGDLGCYGSQTLRTPRIDRMAAEGVRFTDAYAASSVCSPSRAALLTGSYPRRCGIWWVLSPQSSVGLHPDEVTIADVCKTRGYATALIGKWHLGDAPEHSPMRQGFDEFFGLPYSNDMGLTSTKKRKMPPLPLYEGTQVIEAEPDQAQLTRRYTQRATDFIARQAAAKKPFFLMLSHTMPHVPLATSDKFKGKSAGGLYGDVIEELDASTGEVIDAIAAAGIDQNTLVIFTSDNGPWLEKLPDAGSAVPLRGGKMSTYEGGHRVPMIARWPGHLQAGLTVSATVTQMDILPTVARLCGAPPISDRTIDGHDLMPVLNASNHATAYDAFFYYWQGDLPEAVRQGHWKLRITKEQGRQLFDLTADIGETRNLAADHPDVANRLEALMQSFGHDLLAHARPNLDLAKSAQHPTTQAHNP